MVREVSKLPERKAYNRSSIGYVYLIHLNGTIGSPMRPVQHYLGWSNNVEARIRDHKRGKGARMLRPCVLNGIKMVIARTWVGDFDLERKLKRRHDHRSMCPICKGLAPILDHKGE